MSQTRRLAAILAADVAGYSRLMGADEEGTLERLKALRRELLDPKIAEHKGRIVKTTGDGLLVEFASVVDAVRCAVEVQQAMAERNTSVGADSRIALRIGINLGDVIVEGDDLYGDGVNIAARIEALADAGGVFVSNTVHDHVRDRLPIAFEDLGEQQIKNIARPIRVYRVRPEGPLPNPPLPGLDPGIAGEGSAHSARVGAAEPALPLPDKPSIAVLPFANMSGDPEQEYFADGMVEEIITALSRIRWLFVIARNSSFTYKGQSIDVKRVGRELGVRYVLEGSVRKAGGRVRITGQLIDALSGAHLWADRFDGSLEDVFDLQDQVAVSVAGVIEPALQSAEMRRSAARPTTDLTAYDLYLRALAAFYPVTRERLVTALELIEEAIAIDPHYGLALSWAAVCHLRLISEGWAAQPEANRRKSTDLARQALQVGENDPGVLANAAITLAQFGEDIGAMIGLVDRALTLNPSFARGWFRSGLIRIYAGQHDLALSRIGWLFVIARNSTFTYKGQTVDVKQVGRELGVRYVLEGSVRKAGNRVRITAQLIDALSGTHLWADRFDGPLDDIFDLQDKVATSVAGVIEPALQAAETARSAGRPTADLTAYDLYLRAYAMVWSSARCMPDALRITEQAIARDPRYGPALGWAAFCCYRMLLYNRSEDRAADRLKGTDFARRALEVARDDPGVLVHAALALAFFGEDIGAMMGLVDRALMFNPNFAHGWHISGWLRLWGGQPDIAIEHIEAALRLSPRARIGLSSSVVGGAHFLSRRFGQAVPKLLLAIQDDPRSPASYRWLAACYAHMGRLDEAREIVKQLRAITSIVILDVSHYRNPAHRELFLSGLRMAMGEET